MKTLLKETKRVIGTLVKELKYANDVFSETCDCRECSPCERRKVFKATIDEFEDVCVGT